jgi:molecular chaperone GrpE
VAELEATVEELRGRLRAVSAAYQKNQDEVAAARTRLERAAALREELRRGEVVTTLFEPVQNLRRSVDAARRGGTLEDLTKGLEMVLHQAMEGFQKLGLEEVPGKGARFDPRIHDAITTMPVADPALDNIVMEVFSVGYRIGDRVIEPAKVIIGLHDEPANEA